MQVRYNVDWNRQQAIVVNELVDVCDGLDARYGMLQYRDYRQVDTTTHWFSFTMYGWFRSVAVQARYLPRLLFGSLEQCGLSSPNNMPRTCSFRLAQTCNHSAINNNRRKLQRSRQRRRQQWKCKINNVQNFNSSLFLSTDRVLK